MSDTRLLTPLSTWTGKPRQKFTWFARPNCQSVIRVNQNTATQQIAKTAHHNSRSASREYFPQGRSFTTQWQHEQNSAILADISIRKGSNVIVLHHTMAQFHPPVTPPPLPPITTSGDYIARLHPFLQALVPIIDTLGHEFTAKATTAAINGTLRA
jgi:hypothetical protein